MKIINNDFCFKTKSEISAQETTDAPKYYYDHRSKISKWSAKDNKTPILIVTIIIPQRYRTSRTSRQNLSKLFDNNSEKVFLCGQLEKEYIRHRNQGNEIFNSVLTDLIVRGIVKSGHIEINSRNITCLEPNYSKI